MSARSFQSWGMPTFACRSLWYHKRLMAKFLLVEDDPELTTTVQTFLRASGHVVEHTSRGEEALQFQ
ncbi:MAG TPA: hypothetical protein V6D22_22975 [Candidatus Obscuribacterales bacterium]